MLNNLNPIAILLSTFNGAKYLPELMESILRQTYKHYTLFVRDDGSTDDTLNIIRNYAEKDSRIFYIDDNLHLGPTQTFLHLLNEIESDYYMFCDQDDVWLDDKIEISLNKIKELERSYPVAPILVYTDVIVTDGSLNIIANSMWQYSHLNVDLPTSFNYICVYNNISGCTTLLNRHARNTVDFNEVALPRKLYHDWWVAICVSRAGGIIIPIKRQTLLFRRHDNNETKVGTADLSLIAKICRVKDSFINVYTKYLFFKTIGYGSFIKYLLFKAIVSIRTRN